jgi:hypothetical protein
MKILAGILIFATLFTLMSCEMKTIDKEKRDLLVRKYDLMNFQNVQQPVLMSIDEFFSGNNDEASIAPNLEQKLEVSQYYKILSALRDNPKVIDAFVKINDVMIYEDGKLNDSEWFYSDMIYIVGDITKEEVREATKALLPDEVEYDSESDIRNRDPKFKHQNVIYLWWD